MVDVAQLLKALDDELARARVLRWVIGHLELEPALAAAEKDRPAEEATASPEPAPPVDPMFELGSFEELARAAEENTRRFAAAARPPRARSPHRVKVRFRSLPEPA